MNWFRRRPVELLGPPAPIVVHIVGMDRLIAALDRAFPVPPPEKPEEAPKVIEGFPEFMAELLTRNFDDAKDRHLKNAWLILAGARKPVAGFGRAQLREALTDEGLPLPMGL